MTRVFFTVDETNPAIPTPCLHVNGQELRMSWVELNGLLAEGEWIKETAKQHRKVYFKSLATKYKEVQNGFPNSSE